MLNSVRQKRTSKRKYKENKSILLVINPTDFFLITRSFFLSNRVFTLSLKTLLFANFTCHCKGEQLFLILIGNQSCQPRLYSPIYLAILLIVRGKQNLFILSRKVIVQIEYNVYQTIPFS